MCVCVCARACGVDVCENVWVLTGFNVFFSILTELKELNGDVMEFSFVLRVESCHGCSG